MSTLLVLTTGQTDVQIVLNGVRHELRKDCCAALHDELEQRASPLNIVDAPVLKVKDSIDRLPEGDLTLCTPKLDAVLREIVPTAALVLETRRDAGSAAGDPRFAGNVLEARLKARGVETVHRQAYLQGTERLEDRDLPHDAIIRRDVVRRLEHAVRDRLEVLKPSRIVVAATGGFPVVTNLVEEIVRLYASVPVDALEVADGAQASPPTADRAVARTSVPDPLVSFQSRHRALELIAKGNLLGAWAIAEPLHSDETERAWTKVIHWLANFASSLPLPEDCDLAVLSHKRMAVRAALRVELALRAGDIPRAVHATVAFFEAALWDHLGEKTSRHPSKRQFKFHEPPADKLVRERDATKLSALSKIEQREDRDRPFIFKETADGSDWYWVDDNEICAIQLAKHYLKLESLTKLGQALAGDIRELRNDVAHNEPTPALMDDARRRMRKASLWSSTNGFMSQPLVQAALHELGEPQPEVLCTELLAGVRSRLLDASRTAKSEG
ncbi:MAG: hypothetical protein GMKNLPBB_01988 [Myxococcota bacterium]|nr:hypothetical protein [Myxococcota bacterium]